MNKVALYDVLFVTIGFTVVAVFFNGWFELAKWVILVSQLPFALAIWKGRS